MLREQRMVKEIYDNIGAEFNDYIMTLDCNSLWRFSERKIIVNKTFLKVLEVFANYNLTTVKEIMENAYELDNEIFMDVALFMIKDYLNNGGGSLLNRSALFCVNLHYQCKVTGELPSEVLKSLYDDELVTIEPSLKTKILYKFKKCDKPFNVFVDNSKIVILSLISGKSMKEEIKYIYSMEVDSI